MTNRWEAISRDDNYVQISRDSLPVAHVLTAPGGGISGWGVAREIVRACNAHDELVAACEKFSQAHEPGGEDCSMATVDPQNWAEFDAAVKEALL